MNFLLRGPMIDPKEVERGTRIPQTERLSENADLPFLVDGTRLHLGVLVAVAAAVYAWVLLWRTPLGFRLRAVGHSPAAAHAAGIPVKRSIVTALALSGALAGLAGAILVFGSEAHRMGTDGSAAGFTGAAGFQRHRRCLVRKPASPVGDPLCISLWRPVDGGHQTAAGPPSSRGPRRGIERDRGGLCRE